MASVEESVAPEIDNSVDNEANHHEVSEAETVNETVVSVGEEVSDQCLEDQELEAIKARVQEMEEEAEKLKQLQNEVEKQMNLSPLFLSAEEKMEIDNRSIYVGNVDYGATAEELESHFHGCGSVNRVTILCDKFSGHPKGFAYIEFVDKDSVHTAMALDESLFRGRQIKVMVKRTNRPGISTTNRIPRGRFRRGSRNPYYGYRPVRRSFRSRRGWFFSPY